MSREFDLVVFDWDGTLMDSAAKIVNCMQLAAKDERLLVPSRQEVEEIIGLGLPQAIERLFPEASNATRTALQQRYSIHYSQNDQTHTPLFSGVEVVLSRLLDEGYVLAVATGKSRKGLDRVLRSTQLGRFFAASRCADETASKPDPRMLNELLTELNCSGERTLMVGDTEYDMLMAQQAGVVAVAVSYGVHAIERLHAYQPRYCLDRPVELLTHLNIHQS